jgi:hypothetical protein
VPELEQELLRGLTGGSLAATLREAGVVGRGGEEWAGIECLSEADAAFVKVAKGTPFLHLEF